MPTDPPKKIDYLWVAEKFGLFLAPAIAYLLVFAYESSYCRVFGVPAEFIRPDITTILTYTTVIIGVGYFMVIMLNGWMNIRDAAAERSPLQHAFRVYLPFILIAILAASSYWTYWKRSGPIIFFLVLFFILDLLIATTREKDKPLLSRLQGPAALMAGPGQFWGYVGKLLGAEILCVCIAISGARYISIILGESQALNQSTFLVPSLHPDAVVVRVYGDKIYCVGVDIVSRKLTKRLYVLTSGSDNALHFETKKIGPLVFE